MQAMRIARPTCANCNAPMDEVETVAVLASLKGHSIFECEWCRHITLVATAAAPKKGIRWLSASSEKCRRGISCVSPAASAPSLHQHDVKRPQLVAGASFGQGASVGDRAAVAEKRALGKPSAAAAIEASSRSGGLSGLPKRLSPVLGRQSLASMSLLRRAAMKRHLNVAP